MMQSQALPLVIIRKIVEPARDFAHTPPMLEITVCWDPPFYGIAGVIGFA